MKMKRLHLLFFLCFIMSCTTTGASSSILDTLQCELPCWNGITPGETSWSDALQVIKGLDGIDSEKTNVITAPWKVFNKQIWFYLYSSSWLNTKQTDGAVYFINDKVVALSLHRNVGITFGEMVERTGEPVTIISLPFNGANPVVMAIIPLQGVEFEFYAKSNDELQPETEIDNVMFFDSAHYEDLLDAGMFSLGGYDAEATQRIMYTWRGYGDIKELYPPRFP